MCTQASCSSYSDSKKTAGGCLLLAHMPCDKSATPAGDCKMHLSHPRFPYKLLNTPRYTQTLIPFAPCSRLANDNLFSTSHCLLLLNLLICTDGYRRVLVGAVSNGAVRIFFVVMPAPPLFSYLQNSSTKHNTKSEHQTVSHGFSRSRRQAHLATWDALFAFLVLHRTLTDTGTVAG